MAWSLIRLGLNIAASACTALGAFYAAHGHELLGGSLTTLGPVFSLALQYLGEQSQPQK